MKRPLWLVPVIIAPLILTDSNAFASRPAPCTTVTPPPPPVTPTTVDTIGQAYFCVLDHYAKAVDDRDMLMAAFAGLAQELERLGRD